MEPKEFYKARFTDCHDFYHPLNFRRSMDNIGAEPVTSHQSPGSDVNVWHYDDVTILHQWPGSTNYVSVQLFGKDDKVEALETLLTQTQQTNGNFYKTALPPQPKQLSLLDSMHP